MELRQRSDPIRRIGTTMPTTLTMPSTDAVQMKRLIEFAADVSQLANDRADLDLHRLIDDLHRDLTTEED